MRSVFFCIQNLMFMYIHGERTQIEYDYLTKNRFALLQAKVYELS